MASVAPFLSDVLVSIPSTNCNEVPLRHALRVAGPAILVSATTTEMDKHFRFGAHGDNFLESAVPVGSIIVDAHVLNVVPVKYEVYGKIWVAQRSNSGLNVCSHSSTPDILVSGARHPDHYKHPQIQFRQVCLVTMLDSKLVAVAAALGISLKDVEKSEIGACLGFSSNTPGAYDFLLENGSI